MTQDIRDICGEVPEIFIGHTSSKEPMARNLKDLLAKAGLSAYVAHKDMKLTAKWREVIQEKISSADVFLAILSRDFEKSAHCNQELGFAASVREWRPFVSGRSLIIMAFKQKGVVHYGFISDEHAAEFTCETDIPPMVLDTLLEKDFDLWFKSFICRIRRSSCWRGSERILIPELKKIEKLTIKQAYELADAINSNPNVYDAWGFKNFINNRDVQCPDTDSGQISFYYESRNAVCHIQIDEHSLPW